MPRDLPIGNERLLVMFDEDYLVRDLYYPNVGKENHAGGFPFRFGVWVDGRFAWMGRDGGWQISRRYEVDTLITSVSCLHEELGLELDCSDAVDFHETVLLRKTVVRNLRNEPREVRLFYHHDFRISESDVGDTAAYDPGSRTVTHYKGYRYFLSNLMVDGRAGIDTFAIGQKGHGKDGTWRDAEDDGELGMNPIAQGSVDSVIRGRVVVPGRGEKTFYYWLVCAKTWEGAWDGAKEVNDKIVHRGPESLFARTRAYWKLWVGKEPTTFTGLPPSVVELYKRSLLVVRTHIDEGGGIVAANDSDIMQFARDTYSYVWPRDGALVAHALDMAGYPDAGRKFFTFCADVLTPGGFLLHKYNPDRSLASSWHPWVGAPIGTRQGELKLGPAQLPIQEDETALVVWAMWRHFQRNRDLDAMKPLYGRLVRKAADFMVAYREPTTRLPAPSYDLWEERRGILTFTCAAVHGGLMAAAEFATAFGDVDHAETYVTAAREIREGMDRHLYRPELGRFARMVNVRADGSLEIDGVIDASLYGLFAFGAYPAGDPRVEATMRAVYDRLWCKTEVGGVARYEGDYYHAVSQDRDRVPGNPWFICTLWLALFVIAKAKTIDDLADAVRILEWVDSRKLPSGILAEQVNPFTNAPMSVAPLTWSHATVIEVVQAYLEKREAVERCPTCGGPRGRKIEGYERQEPLLFGTNPARTT
jgi:GH15 family glucan-1,4-alpha-glucosidase